MIVKMILYSCFMLLGTFISSLAQVLLKKEADKEHKSYIAEYLNFRVITAYIIFFCATLLSILAYKVIPLSFGAVLDSTSYIYAAVFGAVFFGEKVNIRKILSLVTIISGIIVFSL